MVAHTFAVMLCVCSGCLVRSGASGFSPCLAMHAPWPPLLLRWEPLMRLEAHRATEPAHIITYPTFCCTLRCDAELGTLIHSFNMRVGALHALLHWVATVHGSLWPWWWVQP